MSKSNDAIAVVLAIGAGDDLLPLTDSRTGAAVPFGGNFRLIDFPLTNCLNSGLRKVLVLTQYKSHSLHKHLRDGWSIFNAELGEFITPVPPQMRGGPTGYRGPVDAMQQNLYLLERNSADLVVVLGGDEIYRMDYAAMLRHHRDNGADVCFAYGADAAAGDWGNALPVQIDADGRLLAAGPAAAGQENGRCLGVLSFTKSALATLLAQTEPGEVDGNDLGRELLPGLAGHPGVIGYRFGGTVGRVTPDRYWRRPTTIDDYYAANLDLLAFEPPIDLYQTDWPIRTYQGQMPPARTAPGASNNEGVCVNSIVAAGSVIAGGGVNHSILFPGVRVGDGAIVEDSILLPGVVVGEGAHIRNCVIDKRVRVPAGDSIGLDPAADRRRFQLTGRGVVVIAGDERLAPRQASVE